MRDLNILRQVGILVDSAIAELGGLDVYEDILDTFYTENIKRLEDIKQAKQMDNLNLYKIYVHAMKSESAYLGMTKLSEMAFNHQLKCEEQDTNYINEHYPELIEEVNKILDAIKAYLDIK